MKILIHYTPRSKSTKLISILSKKYDLEDWQEMLTRNRFQKKSHDQIPELIKKINDADNIGVKINGNDFVDFHNRRILDCYKDIDYKSFDRIIFLTRKDYVAATLSFGYMNLSDPLTWHRRIGKEKKQVEYEISQFKIHAIARCYLMHEYVKNFIKSQVDKSKVFDYEFDTMEQNAIQDFDLTDEDFDIDITESNIDYRKLLANPNQTVQDIHNVFNRIQQVNETELNDLPDFFWDHTEDPLIEAIT